MNKAPILWYRLFSIVLKKERYIQGSTDAHSSRRGRFVRPLFANADFVLP
jgi:hypothetical protein